MIQSLYDRRMHERLYRSPPSASGPILKLQTCSLSSSERLRLRQLLDRRFQICRMESKWPRLALVRDLSFSVDQVQPIGPARVGDLGMVFEPVDHRRKLDAQLAHTGSSYERALGFVLGTGEDHLVLDIALHLPDVAGMSFQDVHRVERHLASILLVELVEGRNLPPERRSSIAAEDQHYRFATQRRQLHLGLMVQRRQTEIGSHL